MRFTTLLLSTTLVLAMAAPASAAQRNAGVQLLTTETPVVIAGESLWLTFNWTARRGEVSEFSVTATADRGATVEYPTNTSTFTGLNDGHVLSEGEVDFTAIKVTIPYDAAKRVRINFTVTYEDANGRERTKRFRSTIPVEAFEGDGQVTQLDASAEIESGAGVWVDVDYSTRAPRADNVTMSVVDGAGLTIAYPSQGAATSLHYDDRLSRNETDTARFFVGTEGVEPGQYLLVTETTYDIDGETKSLAGSVIVTVTG